jgi:hypothetical protein
MVIELFWSPNRKGELQLQILKVNKGIQIIHFR